MKRRLMVGEDKYSELHKQLTSMGFEIDDGAELILSKKNVYVKHLIGRKGEEIFRLDVKNITHIESFAHDIAAYSDGEEYSHYDEKPILLFSCRHFYEIFVDSV